MVNQQSSPAASSVFYPPSDSPARGDKVTEDTSGKTLLPHLDKM